MCPFVTAALRGAARPQSRYAQADDSAHLQGSPAPSAVSGHHLLKALPAALAVQGSLR